MTTFSGLKIKKQNKKDKTEYYRKVSFSYPENDSMKQYTVKVYEDGNFIGETELLSTFFQHLFTDAKFVLTNHKTFSTTILTILEK
jgi:hypothetical protein